MKLITTLRRFLAGTLLLPAIVLHAQSDSPCNQGRAVPPRVDPRHPSAICLPELGVMYGLFPKCVGAGGEEYGRQIIPLGDISGDGIDDWIIEHVRCDTAVAWGPTARYPIDILLYHGVRDSLPDSRSAQRIGPTEIGAITSFLACGDWDGDGFKDLAVRIQLINDTSAGNVDRYEIARLVVFWGNASNVYSVQDTTQLQPEANIWIGISQGTGTDLDGDGTDDLLIRNSKGFTDGQPIVIPRLHIFKGHSGQRWGNNAISRTADWVYWNADNLSFDKIDVLDHDSDGTPDVVLYANSVVPRAFLSILYGSPGALPDTADIQSISLFNAGGRCALFTDVTGDHVPELVVNNNDSNLIKIFIGLKGQRLLEQYGSGHDPERPGEPQWWGKPWAQILLPSGVNDYWFRTENELYDLGDGDLDGIGDIWCLSWPYLLCYRGGSTLDDLADGIVDVRPANGLKTAAILGDIDGSGKTTMALGGSGVVLVQGTTKLPRTGKFRRLPEGTAAVPAAPRSANHARPWLSFHSLYSNHSEHEHSMR